MMIDYGTSETWRYESREVRFEVVVDGKPVSCRVTHEVIQDNCADPLMEETTLEIAKRNFDAITDRIGKKAASGAYEADGSLLLRGHDWRGFAP